MNPRVKEVYPIENYKVLTIFQNGEKKIFDVSKYLELEVFQSLRDIPLFNKESVSFGTINWPNGQDFCPDCVYLESTSIN